MDSQKELQDFFESYDVTTRCGITPDAAVVIVMSDDESQLFAHTVDEFIDRALMRLEFAAYEAKGRESEFTIDKKVDDAIRVFFEKNPNAHRERIYADLSSKREVTLPEGTVMSINQHA